MIAYEPIDISGDAGIRASGGTLEEAFAHAALGMYSLVTDPDRIEEKRELSVEVESHSRDGLLVSWLNELIFHMDTYNFVGRTIRISGMDEKSLRAVVSGEELDPERHERRLLVKAATYHRLKIENRNGQWTVEVIFDI